MLQDDQHSSMNTSVMTSCGAHGNSKAFQHAEVLQIGHQSPKVEGTFDATPLRCISSHQNQPDRAACVANPSLI